MKVLVIILMLFAASSNAQQAKVYIISIDGAITQVTEDYLALGISKASENGAGCLVVKLNTPGGLLSSTRDMVSESA